MTQDTRNNDGSAQQSCAKGESGGFTPDIGERVADAIDKIAETPPYFDIQEAAKAAILGVRDALASAEDAYRFAGAISVLEDAAARIGGEA